MRFVMTCLSLLSLFLSGCTSSDQASENIYTNSIFMEFVLIPSGSFMMGADKHFGTTYFKIADDDETPRHRVTISEPFYLSAHEVTQAQWIAVMGNNPSRFKGRRNPVEMVSWDDVQAFIRRLNQQAGHNRYRLPTEAEWEYAARAGTTSEYSFGDNDSSFDRYGWCMVNAGEKTHPVGQKRPNPWGLYDIHGNVDEWVQDWYGERYYANSPGTDPKGPSSGSYRVKRGGGWFDKEWECRSFIRYADAPDYRDYYTGFRLALSPE